MYAGSNILVFYRSNTWAYTRLGKIDCFEKAEFKGKVFAGGVNDQGDIEGHEALEDAYNMGRSI